MHVFNIIFPQATETLFKMGVWRGYFSPIPKGEVYIFAVSVAVLLYFFRSKINKQDQVYKILRYPQIYILSIYTPILYIYIVFL